MGTGADGFAQGPRPFAERVQRLRSILRDDDLAGLLVFDPFNVRYLTGFSGSAGVVLVTEEECVLVSDFRYRVQAREQAPEARFFELEGALSASLPAVVGAMEGTLGIEQDDLRVSDWEKMAPALGEIANRFAGGHVRKMRQVKSATELAAMREAAVLAVRTVEHLLEMRVVGKTERAVALELEFWARTHGSEGIPFPYIVGWGPNGAKPHAEPGASVIEEGGLLVVDLGATVDGYASDITRTFATGKVGSEEARAFEVTLRAQAAGRKAAGPGVACSEVDAAAREVIAEAGLGDLFKHGLGHGVGLEVHEQPSVNASSEAVLEPGMVVTIEPGIYVEGVGGVRIEDSIVITETGIEILTETERTLQTLS